MNYIADFQARSDLTAQYGNNALLLYALQLRFEISDIISVASDALTDGGNDKKCDLIYVDQDTGVAVVAQGYMKQTPKEANLAPGNKASDLNTAATWVFAQNPDEVPEQIREQVRLLQSSIENNFVSTIYFWYVHNLNEQNNPQIKEELTAMQTSARALLKTLFPKNEVEIFAVEVGNETIEKWYNAASKQIAVTDTLDVETPKVGFELTGDKWRAYVTAVSAKWLQQKYATYKDDIFSGNPRTYLGSGKKKNKINLGIMETIDQQPGNFWAYNNGITALVNDYVAPHEGKDDLTISGITIINGAQTTGAISSVETLKDAWIPIRFIVCNDANIIDDIINNNNKQNEILPSDLRSNDKTQNRLRAEFAPYTKLYYSLDNKSKLFPYEGRINHIFTVTGIDVAFFNSGVWIKAAPRFEVGMSLKECVGIFIETELAHRAPQELSPLDQLIQYIARPVYERVPGNDNVKTFDRIRMTVGLPRYQFNSWEALQSEVKKYQHEIYQRVIQRMETNRSFKRYGVPINFLEISNVTLLRDFSLEFIFELKEPKTD